MVDMSAHGLSLPQLREYAASRGLDFTAIVDRAAMHFSAKSPPELFLPTEDELRMLIEDDDRALKGINT